MLRPKLLIADNDSDFLETAEEFLISAGYEAIKASSPKEACQVLEARHVHLAILDLRLVNDEDEKDVSGLTVAKECRTNIPILMLTKYQTWEAVRESLSLFVGERPLAIDFVAKQEGMEELLQRIQHAFDFHILIKWNLIIDWKAYDLFSLVKLIGPILNGEQLFNCAEEFEDLFRRLFYEKDYIRIEHLLWQRDGRVALVVFAYKEGMKPESFVVVCGANEIVSKEAECFNQYAPKSTGDGSTILAENMRAETTHFSANAYSLISNDLETIQSLFDLYRVGPEKTFNAAMDTFYRETLKTWHQDKFIRNRGNAKIVLYSERLHLADVDLQQIEERVHEIESLIPTLEAKVTRTPEKLSIRFKNQSFELSNPAPILSRIIAMEEQGMFVTVPGFLSGDNILTDSTGRTWLTDFADAGLAPVLWNYTSMEALIRYDWVDTKDLQRRYELEQCLVQTDFFKPEIRDLEPSLRKPARAIQLIRKLAARKVGKDTLSYHQGMFFQAVSRLMEFDSSKPVTSVELARYGHILLSMAMLADLLKQTNPDSNLPIAGPAEQVQIFDEGARIILVGNRKERLPRQPFVLFKYLYEKPNQLCTKDDLLKEALQNEYNEAYLHTLVGRIRKAIEDDPEHPRFLHTVPNAGYKLIPKPE